MFRRVFQIRYFVALIIVKAMRLVVLFSHYGNISWAVALSMIPMVTIFRRLTRLDDIVGR